MNNNKLDSAPPPALLPISTTTTETCAIIESDIQVVVQSPAPTMPEDQQSELEQIQEVKDISVDFELHDEKNNNVFNYQQQKQVQEHKLEIELNKEEEETQNTSDENYQNDLMTPTMILTRQDNVIEDDGSVDRTNGLYIRFVIKQEGHPDLVWLYKTHKF